jgi:hypothetical protein
MIRLLISALLACILASALLDTPLYAHDYPSESSVIQSSTAAQD